MKTILSFDNKVFLTSREEEIVRLIIDEFSTKEIAAKLFISFETVKSHRKKILSKLHVRNVAGMVRESIVRGIVSIPNVDVPTSIQNRTLRIAL